MAARQDQLAVAVATGFTFSIARRRFETGQNVFIKFKDMIVSED